MCSRRPAYAAVDNFEIQNVLPQRSAVNFFESDEIIKFELNNECFYCRIVGPPERSFKESLGTIGLSKDVKLIG